MCHESFCRTLLADYCRSAAVAGGTALAMHSMPDPVPMLGLSAIGIQRQFRRPDGSIVDAESENKADILFCGVSSPQALGELVNLMKIRAVTCGQVTSPTLNQARIFQERSFSPSSAILSMSRNGPARAGDTNPSESTPRRRFSQAVVQLTTLASRFPTRTSRRRRCSHSAASSSTG